MLRSMTAFALHSGSLGPVSWTLEMRSVNARGLDLRLRLPEGYQALEAPLRAAIKDRVHRGNVTVGLRITTSDAQSDLALDAAQLDRVLAALEEVQSRAFDKGVTLSQPSTADVLSQRGVVLAEGAETDPRDVVAEIQQQLEPLVADFVGMREQEGAALGKIIRGQLDRLAQLTDQARTAAETRTKAQPARLQDQVAQILGEVAEVDADRLAQELAMLAVKQDVTEELDRLATHVASAQELVAGPQPAGRKLDFLAQEFNREANTLCSKAQDSALTTIGLDLKAVIDQMREQIQNVE